MKIIEKLTYVMPENYAIDMDTFLKSAKGEVDWYGQHVITLEDCDDNMTFGDLILKNITPYIERVVVLDSIHTRLSIMAIFDRIRALMIQSQRAKQNCYLVRFIPSSLDHERLMLDRLDVKLREFSKVEFEHLFPSQKPDFKTLKLEGSLKSEFYVASLCSLQNFAIAKSV